MILKLDYDAAPLPFPELARRLERAGRTIVRATQFPSPSGRGWHGLVLLDPAPSTAMETVALQLLCGSDPLREAYNIERARLVDTAAVPRFWRERWNVLYRT